MNADRLNGKTYKIKVSDNNDSLYVTINDIETPKGLRPSQLFLRSDRPELHQWLTFVGVLVSAVWHATEDADFVASEMLDIFDPRGPYWSGGRSYPSVVAHIGEVVQRHISSYTGIAK